MGGCRPDRYWVTSMRSRCGLLAYYKARTSRFIYESIVAVHAVDLLFRSLAAREFYRNRPTTTRGESPWLDAWDSEVLMYLAYVPYAPSRGWSRARTHLAQSQDDDASFLVRSQAAFLFENNSNRRSRSLNLVVVSRHANSWASCSSTQQIIKSLNSVNPRRQPQIERQSWSLEAAIQLARLDDIRLRVSTDPALPHESCPTLLAA